MTAAAPLRGTSPSGTGPVLAVVQARSGSTRLPAKVLAPLGGTTVLGLLLQRLARARALDAVVVATTTLPDDDAVQAEAEAHGAAVVRGPVDDVLERFGLALDRFAPAAVVRLTADCPLGDPALVDEAVAPVLAGEADVVTNGTEGYLRGFDVEAVRADALARARAEATDPTDRVHVTPWLYRPEAGLRVVELPWPEDHGHLRLTVDAPEDLEVVRAVVDRVDDPVAAPWRAFVEVLEADPALAAVNAHVRQKDPSEG